VPYSDVEELRASGAEMARRGDHSLATALFIQALDSTSDIAPPKAQR
jgi:hypothetical protein